MVVRVRAADGSVQTFPDGTDPAAIGMAMDAYHNPDVWGVMRDKVAKAVGQVAESHARGQQLVGEGLIARSRGSQSLAEHAPHASEGLAGFLGHNLTHTGMVRREQSGRVRQLAPTDEPGRRAIKEAYRRLTPRPMREFIQQERPSTSAAPGSTMSANKPNAAWDAAAEASIKAGRASAALAALGAGYEVATAKDKGRALAGALGSLGGGVAGGFAGAELGALVGAPFAGVGAFPASVAGGLAGSMAGGEYGRHKMQEVYDALLGPRRQPRGR